MSYLVLARKHRPQVFEDVVGQQHIAVTLQNAIKKERVAHGYIFSGPRGIGKTTSARLLAKALNCVEGPTATPCNNCSSCISITQGNSSDVMEIDGASNRGIDDIRSLRETIKYAPNYRYRIVIIDEVHMLTKEAFNALLKTLEEPPSNVIFVLATTEPTKIPETILSRCQRFDFKRISNNDIIEHLKNIAKKENIEISSEALAIISQRAEGGLRDALSMFDQVLAFANEEKVSADLVYEVLGLIPIETFLKIAENIAKNNVVDVLSLLSDLINQGKEIKAITESLNSNFYSLLLVKLGMKPKIIDDMVSNFYALAELYTKEDILRIINIMASLTNEMRISLNPRMLLEECLIKLCLLDSVQSIKEFLTSSPVMETNNKNTNIPPPSFNSSIHQPTLPNKPIQEPVDTTKLEPDSSTTEKKTISQTNSEETLKGEFDNPIDEFIHIITKERGASIAEPLRHSEIVKRENKLYILIPKQFEFIAGKLLSPNTYRYFETVVNRVWKEKIKLDLKITEEEIIKKSENPDNMKANKKKVIPKEVGEIIDLFEGRIVE